VIHAKIFEVPDREDPNCEDTLTQCVTRMSSADVDYYRRRADQEAEAARLAQCCEARLAHEQMAEAYRLLCRFRSTQDDPHLASELSTLLFKPQSTD
jgi:hypothetical protein